MELAPLLLNKLLVVGGGGFETQMVAGRIVEVEAYDQEDPASHSFGGSTPRCRVMFGAAGGLYVYRSYGIHWCANVVCGEEGHGAAVLIRALAPTRGLSVQRRRREKARRDRDLCSGPGKLCAALGIDRRDNGTLLFDPGSRVRLLDDGVAPPARPRVGTRIGISKATDRPWRWWLPDCHHVSSPRGSGTEAQEQ